MYKDVICKSQEQKEEIELYRTVFVCYWNWNQFNCYNFALLNVIPMVTKKEMSIEYTQKETRGKSKVFTTKS